MRKNYDINTFEINFLAEVFYGDEISIHSERISDSELSFLNSVVRKKDNREICRARIQWRKD